MRLSTVLCLALAAGLVSAQKPKEPEVKKGKPNLLAKESSPYLLQHAYNPVAWRPWGKEALEAAKKENKLIFLSIGYSACHWCHVMEKESFANEVVAKILNDNFICIKVDREERPEVDEVYMTALHAMDAQGGWPLSMFLTAEGKPIIGGTYWPREDREIDGRKINGFKSVLNIIIGLQKDKPKEVAAQAEHFAEATKEIFARASRRVIFGGVDAETLTEAFREYKDRFDPIHGGTGQAGNEFRGTKFPTPSTWLFLLKYGKQAKNETALKMVHTTLRKMAEGGIYDHLGGGFHRYSTERTWTVPHFEKMLYDNAQLLELYSLAYQDTKDPLYADVVKQTVAYIEREMISPEGIFYSALDADSEDEEGRHYVWTEKQIDEILADATNAAVFKTRFGVTGKPNFESKEYILRVAMDSKELAERFKLTQPEVKRIVADASAKLMKVRAERERPFKDSKSITAWNGQMIAGLATAAATFEKLEWQALASKAAQSLLKLQRDGDGRLLRIRAEAEGKMVSRLHATLDDYAFLIHGMLNLHDRMPEPVWLEEAKRLATEASKHFGDDKAGGFYFSPVDESLLFTRVKDVYDNAQPAANNVMLRNLFRLAEKTKSKEMRELAAQGLRQASAILKAAPTACPILLATAIEFPEAVKEQPKDAPADKPVKTADVVNAQATVEKDTIVLNIEIGKGWHLYANPPGNGMLASAATKVMLLDGDKEVEAKVEYPKGDEVKDETVGDYRIYKGTVKIVVSGFKPGDLKAATLKVKCMACSEGDSGRCLLPGTITVTP